MPSDRGVTSVTSGWGAEVPLALKGGSMQLIKVVSSRTFGCNVDGSTLITNLDDVLVDALMAKSAAAYILFESMSGDEMKVEVNWNQTPDGVNFAGPPGGPLLSIDPVTLGLHANPSATDVTTVAKMGLIVEVTDTATSPVYQSVTLSIWLVLKPF